MIVFILEINDRNIVAHEFELYEIYQNKYHLNNCFSIGIKNFIYIIQRLKEKYIVCNI